MVKLYLCMLCSSAHKWPREYVYGVKKGPNRAWRWFVATGITNWHNVFSIRTKWKFMNYSSIFNPKLTSGSIYATNLMD